MHLLDDEDTYGTRDPDGLTGLLLEPVGWMRHAACGGMDTEMFFPERDHSSKAAREVCARCPVRPECLDYALAGGDQFGIFGGTSERERRQLRRQKCRRGGL
jgi:WhiB family transcriptional regulator, redox-sensing transcriptional regulator